MSDKIGHIEICSLNILIFLNLFWPNLPFAELIFPFCAVMVHQTIVTTVMFAVSKQSVVDFKIRPA